MRSFTVPLNIRSNQKAYATLPTYPVLPQSPPSEAEDGGQGRIPPIELPYLLQSASFLTFLIESAYNSNLLPFYI